MWCGALKLFMQRHDTYRTDVEHAKLCTWRLIRIYNNMCVRNCAPLVLFLDSCSSDIVNGA